MTDRTPPGPAREPAAGTAGRGEAVRQQAREGARRFLGAYTGEHGVYGVVLVTALVSIGEASSMSRTRTTWRARPASSCSRSSAGSTPPRNGRGWVVRLLGALSTATLGPLVIGLSTLAH